MELHRVWAMVVLCLTTQGLSAQMYKWVDENGRMTEALIGDLPTTEFAPTQ